jgi:hypothetical protein
MKVLKVSASPKQVSRLRNGHAVRIKEAIEGMGFNLLVDPAKFDSATRCFTKGTAYQIQLSPDEIMANKKAVQEGTMEGEGIFAGGKLRLGKAFKKVGSAFEKAGQKTLSGLTTAEEAVRTNPIGSAVVKTAVPMLAQAGLTGLAMSAGADPFTASLLGKSGASATQAGLKQAGYGLYAGQSGRGLYAGGALAGPPSRMPEVSSVSVGGTLLAKSNMHLPPALQSDAMSANFHMNTQLPPHFQRGGIRFV